MVSNHTHGHINIFFLTVRKAGELFLFLDDGLENIGIVVGVLTLQHAHQAFEAHTRIDDVHRKWFESAIRFAVVLHEYDVPDFDNLGIILVYQLTSRNFCFLFCWTRIDMDFGARTAGTCVAHLPEVVVLVAVDDMVGWNMLSPEAGCFVVAFKAFFLRSLKYGDVKVFRVEVKNIDEIFPSIVDRFLFEVIAKAPITEHLKHSMVISVVTYFFKVIMFAAHAQTLL